MRLKNFLHLLILAGVFTAGSACSSGTDNGDTNVERGSNKRRYAPTAQGVEGGDSTTAGLSRPAGPHKPTGKELYKAAGDAKDRNHDGIAD
ncbi:hypothetical protein IC235_17865 [Hymenobacter sp. BT664]|uniref:EF-hand domain-containing protein n=1 Tax=Hymenobacter montanus TaxID=2771359 RepID=A0A927BF64_9BACT|nr:hypothetical protein [Hymenobacter montanus]MBD2769760.1 hypothetical protein [Hymenobacter montanus]